MVGLWDTVEQKKSGGIVGYIRAEEGWWDCGNLFAHVARLTSCGFMETVEFVYGISIWSTTLYST